MAQHKKGSVPLSLLPPSLPLHSVTTSKRLLASLTVLFGHEAISNRYQSFKPQQTHHKQPTTTTAKPQKSTSKQQQR